MIDSRNDLSKLKGDCPLLAERHEMLRFKVSRQIDDHAPAIRDQLLKERREAPQQIEDCLREIRQVPGYERFLLGPTIEELKCLANEGPIVVVNVTDINADAVILSQNQVTDLPLPGLSPTTTPSSVKQFEQYASSRRGDYERDIGMETEVQVEPDQLSWLWSNCVMSVLDKLETMGSITRSEAPVSGGLGRALPVHFHFMLLAPISKTIQETP